MISQDINTNSIVVTPAGFLPDDKFIEICEESLDLLSKWKCKSAIINTLDFKVISQKCQLYIRESWYPRANKLGLEKMAFIIPKSIIAKMSLNAIKTHSGNIQIEYHSAVEDALNWIR